MSSIARRKVEGTGERVRGPNKRGRFNNPELQAVMRHMTNHEATKWTRLGYPDDLDHPIFAAARRRQSGEMISLAEAVRAA